LSRRYRIPLPQSGGGKKNQPVAVTVTTMPELAELEEMVGEDEDEDDVF